VLHNTSKFLTRSAQSFKVNGNDNKLRKTERIIMLLNVCKLIKVFVLNNLHKLQTK
jgi:hypothetical protein